MRNFEGAGMFDNPHDLKWLWDNKGWVLAKLKDVYGWFRGESKSNQSKRGILIIGPGGVGKTTLGRLLSGNYDLLIDTPWRYDESLEIERYTLSGNHAVEVVVPPGQRHRREASWSDLQKDLASGVFRGVIILVANGFHTLGIGYKDHTLYQNNKKSFLKEYLVDCRKDELAILKNLVPFLRSCSKKVWLLTVVAKQDLWWDARAEVVRHYARGSYGKTIGNIQRQKDPRGFHHEIAFASLVIQNFSDSTGIKLKANCLGYDHPLQLDSLRKVFETVDSLKNWESGS